MAKNYLETYGLEIPATILAITMVIFIVYAVIMLTIEAVKDFLGYYGG